MNSGFKKGLAFGALIGGAMLALNKTKKGKEITKKVHAELEDLYDKMGSRIAELGDATRETYEDAVDTMVELYAKNKRLSGSTAEYLADELKKRWQYIQARALYADLKNELSDAAKISRKSFDKAADDLVKKYAKEKSLTKKAVSDLSRLVKNRWEDFKDEMAEEA